MLEKVIFFRTFVRLELERRLASKEQQQEKESLHLSIDNMQTK